MDPERRRQLEARRRVLQARLKRQERRDLLKRETDALEQRGVDYDIVFGNESLVEWLNERFSVTSRGIDWEKVPEARSYPDEAGVPDALRVLLQVEGADEQTRVEVLYGNGLMPVLRLDLSDALSHAYELTSYFEMWFLCRPQGWVIERIAGGGWHWGRVP